MLVKTCALRRMAYKMSSPKGSKHPPIEFLHTVLLPIYKKGDTQNPANYRGIALMSVCCKLLNRLLSARLQKALEPHLRINQNGFRPHRSCEQHITTIRRVVEGCRTHQDCRAIMVFIDFKKAFDSLWWHQMEGILGAFRVPRILIQAIMASYHGHQVQILTSAGLTEPISLTCGVLQGDTCAPYLFVLCLDYVLRQALPKESESYGFTYEPRQSSRHPAKTLTDTDFADDIALLSQSIAGAQKMLLDVEREASIVGLKINVAKTQYIMVGDWSDHSQADCVLRVAAGTIALVDDFRYLGSWIMDSKKDFLARKALAWDAALKLSKIWKSSMSRNLKLRFFKATVETVLLYGAVSWTLTKQLERSLDGAYSRLLRYALNVRWDDFTTNQELYGNLEPVSTRLRKRRLAFIGHSHRMRQYAPQPLCDLLFWEPRGKFRRGGQARKTFIKMTMEDTGLTKEELRTLAQDRDQWSQL